MHFYACMEVYITRYYISVVVDAFPAAEGLRGLPGPVSESTHEQTEVVEVGAAQGHYWTSLRRQPHPPADLVMCTPHHLFPFGLCDCCIILILSK